MRYLLQNKETNKFLDLKLNNPSELDETYITYRFNDSGYAFSDTDLGFPITVDGKKYTLEEFDVIGINNCLFSKDKLEENDKLFNNSFFKLNN